MSETCRIYKAEYETMVNTIKQLEAENKRLREAKRITKEQFLFHYGCEWDTNEFLGWDEVWICIEQLGGIKALELQDGHS